MLLEALLTLPSRAFCNQPLDQYWITKRDMQSSTAGQEGGATAELLPVDGGKKSVVGGTGKRQRLKD